jgi:glutamyl-tRNA synthetase
MLHHCGQRMAAVAHGWQDDGMVASADGRYAPSPTGSLHLGNLRTALAAWLYSRASGGSFHLRIDDLDPDRSRPEHEASQLHDLRTLQLDWDGEPVHQSSRLDRYDEAIDQLRRAGLAYPCFCSRAEVLAAATAPHGDGVEAPYPGTCARLGEDESASRVAAGEPYCLRARADGARLGFDDELLGRIETTIDDFIVRRRDGVAAYNVASPIDESDLHVGLVVRGADLAPTTPRQLWIARRLELDVPRYAHVPLVLGPDGARLAKRHGAASLGELVDRGMTPGQVRSMLARSLGLASATEPEPSLETLVARFDPALLPRQPLRLDPTMQFEGQAAAADDPDLGSSPPQRPPL